MLLSDKYTIYGDFDLKDNLCEYFNCKNIIFDIITSEDDDIPLIDKILYKSDKNKKILLIIDTPTIEKLYQQVRKNLVRENKPNTLMEVATASMREQKTYPEKNLNIKNLVESEEINACTFTTNVTLENDETQQRDILFKNETHNHPTEVEPF